MPDPSPKIINSQPSLTNKSWFYIFVGVKSGVINTVELFGRETNANAALKRVRDDYHPEADDLQIFSVPLTISSITSLSKL